MHDYPEEGDYNNYNKRILDETIFDAVHFSPKSYTSEADEKTYKSYSKNTAELIARNSKGTAIFTNASSNTLAEGNRLPPSSSDGKQLGSVNLPCLPSKKGKELSSSSEKRTAGPDMLSVSRESNAPGIIEQDWYSFDKRVKSHDTAIASLSDGDIVTEAVHHVTPVGSPAFRNDAAISSSLLNGSVSSFTAAVQNGLASGSTAVPKTVCRPKKHHIILDTQVHLCNGNFNYGWLRNFKFGGDVMSPSRTKDIASYFQTSIQGWRTACMELERMTHTNSPDTNTLKSSTSAKGYANESDSGNAAESNNGTSQQNTNLINIDGDTSPPPNPTRPRETLPNTDQPSRTLQIEGGTLRIEGGIFVETGVDLGSENREALWGLELCCEDESNLLNGVIAALPCHEGAAAVDKYIENLHKKIPPGWVSYLKGGRCVLHVPGSPDILSSEFLAGIERLQHHGNLIWEFCVYGKTGLLLVEKVCELLPNNRFVLEHCGFIGNDWDFASYHKEGTPVVGTPVIAADKTNQCHDVGTNDILFFNDSHDGANLHSSSNDDINLHSSSHDRFANTKLAISASAPASPAKPGVHTSTTLLDGSLLVPAPVSPNGSKDSAGNPRTRRKSSFTGGTTNFVGKGKINMQGRKRSWTDSGINCDGIESEQSVTKEADYEDSVSLGSPALKILNSSGLVDDDFYPTETRGGGGARFGEDTNTAAKNIFPGSSAKSIAPEEPEPVSGIREFSKVCRRLAKLDNLIGVKISGLEEWRTPELSPASFWIEAILKIFGYDKCMVGSNWCISELVTDATRLGGKMAGGTNAPNSKSGSATNSVNSRRPINEAMHSTFEHILLSLAKLSASEQEIEKVLRFNAHRIYKLDQDVFSACNKNSILSKGSNSPVP